MDAPLLATLSLGFGLGLRHALDADHLVAICAIAGGDREHSLWRSSRVGALWGLGHTAALFIAAIAVIALRVTIPPAVAQSLELAVGVMLILLGADLLRRVVRGELRIHSHEHEHEHGGEPHAHLHLHTHPVADDHAHHGGGRRPFWVGAVHGLAGSAALTLFVLSTIASAWLAVIYVVIFGVGTIAGMGIMSTLIGMPFALATRRLTRVANRLQLAVGFGSLAFGVFYAWQAAASR